MLKLHFERVEFLNEKIQPEITKLNEVLENDLETNRKRHGIGLKNVNERIKLFYGKEYGIFISSEKNMYTKVLITLPYFEDAWDSDEK